MKLKGTICGQCHNEVLAPFSLTCTLPGHPCHCYNAANNADPGPIAAELHDILPVDGITQMEEMLCSLASPCFIMWVSKGGQYKTCWNIIAFAQDIASPSTRSTDKTVPIPPLLLQMLPAATEAAQAHQAAQVWLMLATLRRLLLQRCCH